MKLSGKSLITQQYLLYIIIRNVIQVRNANYNFKEKIDWLIIALLNLFRFFFNIN